MNTSCPKCWLWPRWLCFFTVFLLICIVFLETYIRFKRLQAWKETLSEVRWHMTYEKSPSSLTRLQNMEKELEEGAARKDFSPRPCSALFFTHNEIAYLLVDWISVSDRLIGVRFLRNGEDIGCDMDVGHIQSTDRPRPSGPVGSLLLSWPLGTEPIINSSEPFDCVFVFRHAGTTKPISVIQ